MFDLPMVELSSRTRSSGGVWLSEFVATFGLLVTILGVVRTGRTTAVAFAVGGYIAAAYWFTSSTSFANPAVTIGRTLTDTFAGIRPANAPMYILVQVAGALVAVVAGRFWFASVRAPELVVPHEPADVA
jgi:arsenate reductase